jgi:hypothetical protein
MNAATYRCIVLVKFKLHDLDCTYLSALNGGEGLNRKEIEFLELSAK